MRDVTYMNGDDIAQALREWAMKVRGRPVRSLIVDGKIRTGGPDNQSINTVAVSAEIEWGPEVDASQR